MEYRNFNGTYYVRLDRGEEIIRSLMDLCKQEGIRSAVFNGIGGCSSAEIQTFLPETGSFETETLEGMLELLSLTGNIVTDENGNSFHHTHGIFSYKEGDSHSVTGGHMKSTVVRYTAEMELRPVVGGQIGRRFDPETGTGFWSFGDSR